MTNFICLLCCKGGRKTLAPPAKRGWAICEDCAETIEASGRVWCNPGTHVIEPDIWRKGGCKACRATQMRQRRQDPAYRRRQQEITQQWKERNPRRHAAYQQQYHARHWAKYEPQRRQWRKERTMAIEPPKGFLTPKELARRLHLEPQTIRDRLQAGWAVDWVRVGRELYIEDRQSYPPMPVRLGTKQQALYDELEYPKAVRALAQGRSLRNVRNTLYLLKRRGLVRQVSYGVWERV